MKKIIRFKELNYKFGEFLPPHKHTEGQVLFARSGTMEIKAGEKFILAPSSRVVWVPPMINHSVHFQSDTKMRTAYIEKSLLTDAFKNICVFQASNLFREILLRLTSNKVDDPIFKELLTSSLLKEMSLLEHEPFTINFPKDSRAKRIAEILLKEPSITKTLDDFSYVAACSSKTLSRLFIKETGMTFQIWRRHLRLLLSHNFISKGLSITNVAYSVGFGSSSAFAEAHRKVFGFPPSYLFNRK